MNNNDVYRSLIPARVIRIVPEMVVQLVLDRLYNRDPDRRPANVVGTKMKRTVTFNTCVAPDQI